MSEKQGGKPEEPEVKVVPTPKTEPMVVVPELGTIRYVKIDGDTYVRGDNVAWPVPSSKSGARSSGCTVEDIFVHNKVVHVKLRSVEGKFRGQISYLCRHEAGCSVFYEGDVPAEIPNDVIVEGDNVRPKSIAGIVDGDEKPAMPDASLVQYQENLGEVERLLNRKTMPETGMIQLLKSSLDSPFLDPERKQKTKKFLGMIVAMREAQAEMAAKRKARERAEVG